MKIGVPKEVTPAETRVALVPGDIKKFRQKGHEVYLQAGAGEKASIADEEYVKAGAVILKDASGIFADCDVILKVQAPAYNEELKRHEKELFKEGTITIGFLALNKGLEIVEDFQKKRITSFAMEFVPRISRAQGMDALSSMATIAGYKAVLIAADMLPRMFPLLMTAAGTVPPATVLVLGAGVAGLQAIATARRLGAKVEAFDPRPAVKEQVRSLGAQFIEMALDQDVETAGGYAKMQSDEFLKKEQEAIASRLAKTDVVITTAQVFGGKSPILITEEMTHLLKPGSVIIDIAAEQGGNCALTRAGETVETHGVSIVGAVNLPAQLPVHASQLYSRNISNLFFHLFQSDDKRLDMEDEITSGACITRNGEVVNSWVGEKLKQKEKK